MPGDGLSQRVWARTLTGRFAAADPSKPEKGQCRMTSCGYMAAQPRVVKNFLCATSICTILR